MQPAYARQGDPFDFPADEGGSGGNKVGRAHESSNEDLPHGKGTKPAAVSRKTRPVAEQPQQQQQPPSGGARTQPPKVYARSKPANALNTHAEEEAGPAAEAAAKRGKAAADEELSTEEAEQEARPKQGRGKTGQQRTAAAKQPAAAKPAAHGGRGKSEAVQDAASSGSGGEEGDDESEDSSSEDEYQPTQKGKRQRAQHGDQVCAPP